MRAPLRTRDGKFEIRTEAGERIVVRLDTGAVLARYPRDQHLAFFGDSAIDVHGAVVELGFLVAHAGKRLTSGDLELRSTDEVNDVAGKFADGDEEDREQRWRIVHRNSEQVIATFHGWSDEKGNRGGTRSVELGGDGLALIVDGERLELSVLLGSDAPRRR